MYQCLSMNRPLIAFLKNILILINNIKIPSKIDFT